MIDDNFNDPVTAYLKGKAIQEKKAPIPDRVRDPNVCSYCHSSTVHTVTHHCAQMERPLTRQDVLDIGAWFNDEKRMNIGRDVQGKALSLVGDNLRLRDELDHESAAAKEFANKYHEAMNIMGAWKNIDHAEAVSQLLALKEDQRTAFIVRTSLVKALNTALTELRAIQARDGAPQHIVWDRGRPLQTDGCAHDWWDAVITRCEDALALASKEYPN